MYARKPTQSALRKKFIVLKDFHPISSLLLQQSIHNFKCWTFISFKLVLPSLHVVNSSVFKKIFMRILVKFCYWVVKKIILGPFLDVIIVVILVLFKNFAPLRIQPLERSCKYLKRL